MVPPKHKETSITGGLGVTIIQETLERKGWVFRRQDGNTDFGIDGEIEITDKNYVTGHVCKCQVKGTKDIDWQNDSASVQVRVSTHNLWARSNFPVIVFLVDTEKREAYWSSPLVFAPREGAATVSIKFDKNNLVTPGEDSLDAFLSSWFSSFSNENILREVPYFYRIYQDLNQRVDWGDPWCQISDEDDANVRLFYKHLLQLRSSLGLLNQDIPSLESWYVRSAAMWDDDFLLFHAVFSELIKIIGPKYDEAITELKKKLEKVKENFENQEIINFFLELTDEKPSNVTYVYRDERFQSENFHRNMENKLREAGALRFSWFDKKKNA
ncbi:MAG: DUF4365 domain-containing protein [Planctomycetes bacterium]|uniref:DUF4365 domain-containing protein n=1 Tax=Candidatus Wunengus sp. YC65 TaxID=3367701 RepID=UPI001D26644A|nr:DUF4365 domain-containing protein [Planctomycetota bacterium]MBI5795326.1 DUF4365 domain-containing protein [Planctomycetota bacterium]